MSSEKPRDDDDRHRAVKETQVTLPTEDRIKSPTGTSKEHRGTWAKLDKGPRY
jgi:hypothetical protein